MPSETTSKLSMDEIVEIVCLSVEQEMGDVKVDRTSPFESLGVESLDLLGIIQDVEKRTGVIIPDAEQVFIFTVEDLAMRVHRGQS